MTLDDVWRLDLSKMDGWTCVKVGSQPGQLRLTPLDGSEGHPQNLRPSHASVCYLSHCIVERQCCQAGTVAREAARKLLLCVCQENTGGEAAFKEEQGSDWETGEDEDDNDEDGDDEQ